MLLPAGMLIVDEGGDWLLGNAHLAAWSEGQGGVPGVMSGLPQPGTLRLVVRPREVRTPALLRYLL